MYSENLINESTITIEKITCLLMSTVLFISLWKNFKCSDLSFGVTEGGGSLLGLIDTTSQASFLWCDWKSWSRSSLMRIMILQNYAYLILGTWLLNLKCMCTHVEMIFMICAVRLNAYSTFCLFCLYVMHSSFWFCIKMKVFLMTYMNVVYCCRLENIVQNVEKW